MLLQGGIEALGDNDQLKVIFPYLINNYYIRFFTGEYSRDLLVFLKSEGLIKDGDYEVVNVDSIHYETGNNYEKKHAKRIHPQHLFNLIKENNPII